MPLCCKTKINTTLMCEVLDKDTIKPEILPHLSVAKRGYASKSNLLSVLSTHSLQVESIFPVAHNEEKVKRSSLCFLCSYVRMNVFMLGIFSKYLTNCLSV